MKDEVDASITEAISQLPAKSKRPLYRSSSKKGFKLKRNKVQKKKMNIYIFGGGILLVLAVILYFVLRQKDISAIFDRSIPYIFDQHYLETLSKFTSQETYSKPLLVYGPQGIGKTRGLFTFSNQLKEQGRLVIDLDFIRFSKYSTGSDLTELIISSVLKAFKDIDGKAFNNAELKASVSGIKSVSAYASEKVTKKRFLGFIKDPYLQKTATSLISLIETGGLNAALTLFESVEGLSSSLKPIIIIHEPNHLFDIQGCDGQCEDAVKMLTRMYSSHCGGLRRIGIIIEISDQLQISKLLQSDKFVSVKVGPVLESKASDILVKKESFFTSKEFERLFSSFGGFLNNYARVYERMADGESFLDAVEGAQADVAALVWRAASFPERRCALSGLSQAPSACGQVPAELAAMGLVSAANATHCELASTAVRRAVLTFEAARWRRN